MPTSVSGAPVRRHRKRRSRSRRRRRSPLLPLLLAVLLVGGVGLALHTISSGETPDSDSQEVSDSEETETADSLSESADQVLEPPECPDWITQELLPINIYSRPGTALTAVNGIVVHYVGNAGTTAQNNRNYFAGLAETGEAYASSHFVIGLEGEIIQCVPLDEVAYCSNDRNSDTISIECCHADDTGAFNQATYESLVKLVTWLAEYYGLDRDQVIRHYDVTGKLCPLYYVEHEDAWEAFKDEVFADESWLSGLLS